MTPFNPDVHHRQSIRLKGYDYARVGAYFVTICTYQRQCQFGEIVDRQTRLNVFGQIVSDEWLRTAVVRPNVTLDCFVVMPNHLHAILILRNSVQVSPIAGSTRRVAPTPENPFAAPRPNGPPSQSVGAIVRQFKSIVTKRINTLQNAQSLPVWQRNYHEHIIRDDAEMARIRTYIADNPSQWLENENHPQSLQTPQQVVWATRRVAHTTMPPTQPVQSRPTPW